MTAMLSSVAALRREIFVIHFRHHAETSGYTQFAHFGYLGLRTETTPSAGQLPTREVPVPNPSSQAKRTTALRFRSMQGKCRQSREIRLLQDASQRVFE